MMTFNKQFKHGPVPRFEHSGKGFGLIDASYLT